MIRRIIKPMLVLSFLLAMAPEASAVMGVTEVSIQGREAVVVLDGYLKIANIDVQKRGDQIRIRPPIYVSKAGKIFPQVDFKSSALENRIVSAIKTEKPVGGVSSKLSYKVSKMSIYEASGRSSMKAFAAVLFNGQVEVECKVNTGPRGLWVSWPTTKVDGKWVNQVDIIKPDVKKQVEKSVIDKYEKETSFAAEIVPGGKTLPLTVTDVEVTPVTGGGTTKAIATVVLNNAIKISEIQVREVVGRTRLEYPSYVNKAGRVYAQLKILDPAFERELIEAITNNKVSAKPSNQVSYKVSKYSPFTRGGSSLKAFSAVTFNNKIEIECKVMEGSRGLWVSWPSRAPEGGGNWINQVEIKDNNLKSAVEKALTDRHGAR